MRDIPPHFLTGFEKSSPGSCDYTTTLHNGVTLEWFLRHFQDRVIFTLLIVALCVGWMRSCVTVNPFDNEKSIFVDSHSVQLIPESQRWEILKFCVNEINWTFLTSFLERTTYEVSHSYQILYKIFYSFENYPYPSRLSNHYYLYEYWYICKYVGFAETPL